MDPKLVEAIAAQQYALDRKVGFLLVREVPQTWKAIDLHVFSEWHPDHLELDIELESPEDHPTVDVSDALTNVIDDYIRMFKNHGHLLSGMYIAMRQKEDGNWRYKIRYEYPDGTEQTSGRG